MVLKDGVFYTGMFSNDQMVGRGQLLTEDDAEYIGEFVGECHLQGRGNLTLPNGDVFQGNFSGHWSDKAGVKVNGIFCRSLMSPTLSARERTLANAADGGGGQSARARSVEIEDPIPPNRKWTEIFGGAEKQLLRMRQEQQGGGGSSGEGGNGGGAGEDSPVSRSSSMSSIGRSGSMGSIGRSGASPSTGGGGASTSNGGSLAEGLYAEAYSVSDAASYEDVKASLFEAFDAPMHPLCRAFSDAAFAFKASYKSAGCHRRLLQPAVAELQSIAQRLNSLVGVLYPRMDDAGTWVRSALAIFVQILFGGLVVLMLLMLF